VRLRAAWLSIVVTLSPAAAADLSQTLDEAVTRLAERVVQAEQADEDRRAQIAEQALSELKQNLLQFGTDQALVQALVPQRGTDDDRELHPLAQLRRQQRRLSRFAEAVAENPAYRADALTPSSAETRARLTVILEEPMFRSTPVEAGPLERARHWLSSRWNKLMRTVSGVLEGNFWLTLSLFGAVVIAALVGLGILLVRTVGTGDDTSELRVFEEPVETSSPELPALFARARAAAGAGREIEALKLILLAATTALRSRGELPRQPGLTDLEGLRILESGESVELRGDFGDLAALHDRGVYGGRGVDDAAIERAMHLSRRIVTRAPETRS
jgi:hypothetical protein